MSRTTKTGNRRSVTVTRGGARSLPPGTWLGVLGGGQLGRMFAMAAHRLGYRVAVLDPDPDCVAASAADDLVCARLDDPVGWQAMAARCAAVTIETENVPARALAWIGDRVPVAPDAHALSVAQDRIAEKRFLASHGFAVAPFATMENASDLHVDHAELRPLLPGILKSAVHGYDGKGQHPIRTLQGLHAAWRRAGSARCVLEQRVALAAELSVVLARAADGTVAVYPSPANRHAHGILRQSTVPSGLPARLLTRARETAIRVATALDYHGVLCVEFFLTREGKLLINEIAPRPHNSGHYTLDACAISQFEQQVRVLAGLPLGDTQLLSPAVMINILGDAWQHGEPDWSRLLRDPRARLHLYGKQRPALGRKMGHVTYVNAGPSSTTAAQSTFGMLVPSRRVSGRFPKPLETSWQSEARFPTSN